MCGIGIELERNRELLSQAILDVLRSWPELHQRVFVQAHYQGRSVEAISGALGLSPVDARMILESCDRRLRAALRGLRDELNGNAERSHSRSSTLSVSRCYS